MLNLIRITMPILLLLLLACATTTSHSSTPVQSVSTQRSPTLIPDTPVSETSTAIPSPQPTDILTPNGLPTVDCPEPCNRDYRPVISHVEWLEPPQVDSDGRFTLIARIKEDHDLVIANPKDGGRLNLHFTKDQALYGSILPANNIVGYKWKTKPSSWEADVYDYVDNTLTVQAQIDPAAATFDGLEICLWRGGATREETYILGCTDVEQP